MRHVSCLLRRCLAAGGLLLVTQREGLVYTPSNAPVMARPYDYDQPAGYDASKPYPLIVLLHGYGANGFVQDALFGWAQLADDRGVFVAHPDGTVDAQRRALLERDRRLLRHRAHRRRRRRLPERGRRRHGGELQHRQEARLLRRPLQRRLHVASHGLRRRRARGRDRGARRRQLAGRRRSATRPSRWRCCRCTATPTPSCPTTAPA